MPHEAEIGVDAAHEMLRVGFAPCRAALLGLSVESVQTAHRFSEGAVGDVDALSLDDRAEEFNAFLVVLQVILFRVYPHLGCLPQVFPDKRHSE